MFSHEQSIFGATMRDSQSSIFHKLLPMGTFFRRPKASALHFSGVRASAGCTKNRLWKSRPSGRKRWDGATKGPWNVKRQNLERCGAALVQGFKVPKKMGRWRNQINCPTDFLWMVHQPETLRFVAWAFYCDGTEIAPSQLKIGFPSSDMLFLPPKGQAFRCNSGHDMEATKWEHLLFVVN